MVSERTTSGLTLESKGAILERPAMSKPNLLTNNQLEILLKELEGKPATFVRLESKTVARANVKSRKTLEPFASIFGTDTVWKIDSRSMLLNVDYERVVNRRRVESGLAADFKSEGTYGKMEGKCILHSDKGDKQVRLYHVAHHNDNARWVRADGTELSPELVSRLKSEFLPERKPSAKQGLEGPKSFLPLNFKMESIKSLRMKGVEYIMAGV
jgi:hypothetical protein